MNPLVRDLYKRVLIVGKDYPGRFYFLMPRRAGRRGNWPIAAVFARVSCAGARKDAGPACLPACLLLSGSHTEILQVGSTW